jgi:ribonuclease HI
MSKKCFAYVDGSFDSESKRYGIGVVMLDDKHELLESFGGSGDDELWASSQNITAELWATMKAIQWALAHDYLLIEIRHDLEGTEKWANKKWAANKITTQAFQMFIDKARASIDVSFRKVKGHSGDYWNEVADNLAKQSLKGV